MSGALQEQDFEGVANQKNLAKKASELLLARGSGRI
jgi:hypothetical protein